MVCSAKFWALSDEMIFLNFILRVNIPVARVNEYFHYIEIDIGSNLGICVHSPLLFLQKALNYAFAHQIPIFNFLFSNIIRLTVIDI